MSSKNSEMDHDRQSTSKTVHASSLRSKNSIEQERRRKLVKFNAVAEIKELSAEDSNDSKLNAFVTEKQATVSGPVTSTLVKEKDTSFHSKRRNHYKNEFTNSKTSKHSDKSD